MPPKSMAAREAPSLAVFGVLVYTITLYAAGGQRISLLATIRHELILGVILIAFCAVVLTENPLSIDPYRNVVISVILLFVVMLTQVPFAYDPALAWDTFFNQTFKQALFALFLAVLIRSPRHLRWFMIAWIFSLFWLYQESVKGWVTGSLMWYNQGILRLHGSVPKYHHPNGLSLIAVTCIPFVISLFTVARKPVKLILLGITALASICIIYSGSRTGYVNIVGVVFFWWVFAKKKGKGLAIGAVALAVILMVVPDDYIGRFESIGGAEEHDGSRQARMKIMEDAWTIFLENPGGVGVDCFRPARMDRFGRFQGTHQLYLQVVTHLGAHGFIIFCIFTGSVVWGYHNAVGRLDRVAERLRKLAAGSGTTSAGRQALKKFYDDTIFVRQVAMGGRLYIIMLLVDGFFAHTLYLVYWWFATGLAVCVLNMTASCEEISEGMVRSVAAQELADQESAGKL